MCEQEHHDVLFEEARNYLSTSDDALDSLLSNDVVPLNKKKKAVLVFFWCGLRGRSCTLQVPDMVYRSASQNHGVPHRVRSLYSVSLESPIPGMPAP